MGTEPILFSNRIPEIEAFLAGAPDPAREETVAAMLEAVADVERPLLERISAGNVLGILGDPRIDPLRPAMCAVPRGPFWMGTEESEAEGIARRYGIPVGWMLKSTPRHRVELDAYEIARFPVTEGEYRAFLEETGVTEIPPSWRSAAPPRWRSSHPVHGVSWQGVLLYAEWVSERTGIHYRVPTEAEWEKGARGVDGRAFPWGERFETSRCNTREGGVGHTTAVGVYPAGASPCGAMDLAGNVEEYTADLYWPYPGCTFEDGGYGTYRMTRGGVFTLDADLARCDRRHGTPYAGPIGFRLVRSAADEWLDRAAPT